MIDDGVTNRSVAWSGSTSEGFDFKQWVDKKNLESKRLFLGKATGREKEREKL